MITIDNIISAVSNTELQTWLANAVTTTPPPAMDGVEFLEEMISAYHDAQTTYNNGVAVGDPTVTTVSEPSVPATATNESDGSLSKTETWTITLRKIYSPNSYSNVTGVQAA
jgi:hypothetical protein